MRPITARMNLDSVPFEENTQYLTGYLIYSDTWRVHETNILNDCKSHPS